MRPATSYGRHQVAEPPHALRALHLHDGVTQLREVDHEPKVGVLDQQDLLAQGIDTSALISGAQRVDALGSCTANALIAAASNVLSPAAFAAFVRILTGELPADPYADVTTAEKAAIVFYNRCTGQTGDPGQEWPPTDCGSSGPYIVSEAEKLRICSGAQIAHGAQNIVSLLQSDGILMGSPWLYAWEEPDANGFIDGDGSAATLQAQLQQGVAGGHETYLCAIEKLVLLPTGQVDPYKTIVRDRNSWSRSWGDNGCCRFHLSTVVAFGGQCDFRQLTPLT